MTTYRSYGPNGLWVSVDDLVKDCLIDVCIKQTRRGWAITDLCISLAPPVPLRDHIDYEGERPRLSTWAVYPTESDETIRGLTSKHLQAIKVDAIRQAIADELDGGDQEDPEWDRRLEDIAESMRTGRNKRRDDLFHAKVAAVYLDVTATSKRGIYREMAKRLPYAESTLSDIVKEARNRDLLSRTIHGRAGGTLTDKAIELLERNEQ